MLELEIIVSNKVGTNGEVTLNSNGRKFIDFCTLNKVVCQCCPPSPILFYIYSDEIITKWQNQDITGIKLSKNQQLSTLLFAVDQVIIADTEYNLQKAAHKLNQIKTQYGLTT